MSEVTSEIPIKQESVAVHRRTAKALVTSVNCTPTRDLSQLRTEIQNGKEEQVAFASMDKKPKARSLAIFEIAKRICGGDDILDEDMSVAINTVVFGLSLGMYMATQYDEFSGLRTLRQQATKSDSEQVEMSQKIGTTAAIAVYVASYYVSWRLASYKKDELAAFQAEFLGIPESLPLTTQMGALGSLVFHWGSYLEGAQSSFQALKLTQLYFAAALDEIKRRSGELKYTDAFTGQRYKLEKTNLVLNGFKGDFHGAAPVVEFKRTELQEVVGNHEAKRLAQILVQFLLAYCFTAKKNPLVEIGAFPWLVLYQGFAGTGKSMLLRVIQTLLSDYCKELGIPFSIRPLPIDIVSSLQGDSAKAYREYWESLSNPNELVCAPGDDCEVIYLKRDDHSSSEGNKMVVQAHLQLTEGSTAINRGNVLKVDATNNAFMIDPAVFSRYLAKVLVPGAQSRNDFLDQMKIFGDGVNKLRSESPIITLEFPKDYQHLSDQGQTPPAERERMEARKHSLVGFKDKGLVQVYESVKAKNLTIDQYDLYGTLFANMKAKYPQFTSRDVRNIQTCVMSRLFGFPFPKKWFDDKDVFFAKDYEARKRLIIDSALEYQGGLSVAEIVYQEMVYYVEATIQMLDSGRKARIDQMANQILEQEEAAELARLRKQGAPSKA